MSDLHSLTIDRERLIEAVIWATSHEAALPRRLRPADLRYPPSGPNREALGPVRDRGPATGLVIFKDRTVGTWGDPARVDMSFSVSKSYLSAVAGLTVAAGLLEDIHAPVRDSVPGPLFASPQNRRVTWHQLLQQTSEWQGDLFGKPVGADQGAPMPDVAPPGTRWAYSDVRTNLLALALLRVWRRPLSDVLRERLMDPIGASRTWRWHGFRTSFVDVAGRRAQSVTAGLWGGGMWSCASDDALFGRLYLRGGRWGAVQVLGADWIEQTTKPCARKPTYGYLWWLNTAQALFPNAPATGYCALGGDRWNMLWVDPAADLVVVSRWGADQNGLLARVYYALGV